MIPEIMYLRWTYKLRALRVNVHLQHFSPYDAIGQGE